MRKSRRAIAVGVLTATVLSFAAMGSPAQTPNRTTRPTTLDANAQRGSKFFFHTQTSGIRALYPTAIIGGFLNGSGA